MSKNRRRVLLATMISTLNFVMTYTWYKLSDDKPEKNTQSETIAHLVTSLNDVQRKSVKKLIWQPVYKNEKFQTGEAVRTADGAEARIEFINSKAIVDLESDSTIIIEENNGQLSLDFIKGNIYIKNTAPNTTEKKKFTNIALKSGDKLIDLGQSEIALGKSQNGKLNAQVLKGSVAELDKISQDNIQIIRPMPNEPVYIHPQSDNQTEFAWKPLPKGYQVFLEAGSTRTDLLPIAGSETLGELGLLKAKLKLGRNYFRLVARTQDLTLKPISSAILRATIVAKIPPQPLAPENDAEISLSKDNPGVTLVWSNPTEFKKIIVEVAATPDLKHKITTQYVDNISQYSYQPENNGKFYWRVSGVFEDKNEVISSSIMSFSTNIINELKPPAVEFPKANEKFNENFIKEKGIVFSWKSSPMAENYKIIVEKNVSSNENVSNAESTRMPTAIEKIYEKENKLLQARVTDLKPGEYTWTVTAIDKQNKQSKPSEKRHFSVNSLPLLKWADGKNEDDFYYLSLRPSVTLKWEKGGSKATSWVVIIYSDDSSFNPITKKVSITGIDIELPQDGAYHAVVEAYDTGDTILARSSRRAIRVAAEPLLPAPKFTENVPTEIEASPRGTTEFQWSAVQGANKYIVFIKSADNKSNKELNFSSPSAKLKKLMPGEYKVSLRSVDNKGRAGPEGEIRILKVPNQSNMRAPKLKGIKVN
ncbi:MAG: hypothetical protein A2Z20_12945 [Bdellovibrionales bacterium RBG_16_40_8]|nr:MAG: hypothetical protein A2Z20_12945 [Bdellovibrionales bacterium RBG_16_40_8]